MAREYHLPESDATIPEPALPSPSRTTAIWSATGWIPLVVGTVGVVIVAAAANRGFDLSDEGSYWWASANPDRLEESVTQYHRITGALFSVLGWNVVLVRLARIVLVIGSTLLLADATVRWLTTAGVPVGRDTRLALMAAGVMAPLGGSIWLPQTLAYNDLVLIELLVMGAAGTRAIFAADHRRAAAWAALAGMAVWAMAMTKFSAAGAVLAMSVGMVLFAPFPEGGNRRRLWVLAMEGVGFLLGAGLWHVGVLGLADTWRGMQVGFDDASSSHESGFLLEVYDLDFQMLALLALLTSVGLVARRWLPASWVIGPWMFGAAALVVWGPFVFPDNPLNRLTSGLFIGPLAIAAALVWRGRSIMKPPSPLTSAARHRMVLTVLFGCVPVLAALGTNNSLFVGAINLAPFWMLTCATILSSWDRPRLTAVTTFVAVSALAYTVLGVAGTWNGPYRQAPLWEATDTVADVERLDGVRLESAAASSIATVNERVAAYTGGAHHWMIPPWRLPGLAYATESDTPQFVWDAEATSRNTRAIEQACGDGDPLVVVVSLESLDAPDVTAQQAIDSLGTQYAATYSANCDVSARGGWDDLGTVVLDERKLKLVGLPGTE